MSHYTTEVRYICETTAGLTESEGFNSIDTILDKCTDDIFNFDYPIFDEAYRFPLNKKILRHFYTREIGEETVGLWKLRLQQTLNEIMPYYNKLYESELYDLNPFYNVDLTTDRHVTGNKTENVGESSNSNTRRTGTRNENYNENRRKQGTDTDNTKNVIDRTNNSTDAKTKTTSLSDKEKEVKNSKYDEHHSQQSTGFTSGDNKEDSTVNKAGNSTDKYSDTPQGGLNSMTGIEGNTWLTNARLINNGETTTTHTEGSHGEIKTDFIDGGNDGTGNETTTTTGSKSGTEKTSGTNKLTGKETGTKTGTKNINETINTSGNNNRTDNFNTSVDGEKSTSGRINNIEDYLEHVKGYKGTKTFAEILMQYRKSFLNIDKMILDDLDVCFFQLW